MAGVLVIDDDEEQRALIRSPLDFVTSGDPPVLLIHGEADQILPMEENSSRLHGILSNAGVRNELVVVDAGHELFTGEAKATADRVVVEWFRRNLLEQ